MQLKRAIPVALAAAAIAAPAAQAHVTLQPNEAPAGGFTRLNVRVPNEEDKANTTKVQVQMPPGFVQASYESVPGWTVKVAKRKLAKPVKTDDGEVTEEVSEITWTGNGKEGVIAPGQFRDFGLSVAIPDGKPGSKLTFKALQTYDDGKVVRWIGPPNADEPAPQVTLTAAQKEGAAAPSSGGQAATPAATTSKSDSDDFASKGLGIAALVIGILALIAGIGAFVAAGRRNRVAA
jgi:periplasmic copper chaperone A